MPVSSTCNEALNDINSVLDRNNLRGLRFPEHFMSKYTATKMVYTVMYTISQLTIQLITER